LRRRRAIYDQCAPYDFMTHDLVPAKRPLQKSPLVLRKKLFQSLSPILFFPLCNCVGGKFFSVTKHASPSDRARQTSSHTHHTQDTHSRRSRDEREFFLFFFVHPHACLSISQNEREIERVYSLEGSCLSLSLSLSRFPR